MAIGVSMTAVTDLCDEICDEICDERCDESGDESGDEKSRWVIGSSLRGRW